MGNSPNQLPEDHALYPLTPFDRLFERSTFVTGWLLEGKLDEQVLSDAIQKVTEKWRMLAGRVVSREEGEGTSWYLKIPLGPLPPTYATYKITTTSSPNPLSFYNITLPLQHGINNSLPYTLFLHADTPRHYKAWAEGGGVPLTCWHLTYFNEGYTCLGFARSHGVFDGVGAVQVVNAVVDELAGNETEWTPPPLPLPGMVENPVQRALEEISAQNPGEDGFPLKSPLYSAMGVTGALGMAAWHLRERYWRNAVPRCLVIPDRVVTSLVRGVRQRVLEERGRVGLGTEEVSTGDVLVAWLMKTIYSRGTNPHTTVHCSNLASFRSLLGSDKEILKYPHNAWTPLPYPPYSVEDLNSLPLHELSRRLAEARHSFDKVHVACAYNTLRKHPLAMPVHETADESFLVSNVSASRILEADWGMKTICGYRYSLTPNALLLTNSAYVSGRLPNGSHLIEVTVSEERIKLVKEEVNRLIGV
ncbi:hypothetical protein E1B28_003985 [Marasmius oreades]|uniref:Uncharacterized protein n=1 Tax=Marasmius oreades TaxID=181124 RepID=A0A9P7UXP3_9AGAR|nr:uncharacterized protein E1B28_003985 [Marasmius oreades]KAG7096563.1 hypothetical protein E1B28_003985 [Marasmius oreades]